MRISRLVAVVAALSLGAILPAGAADFADDCYDGSVLDASAERPHVWDPADDQLVKGPTHGDSTDLRSAWVSGVDGHDAVFESTATSSLTGASASMTSGTGRKLTAHIQVTEMIVHPVNAQYRFQFQVGPDENFVLAEALPDGDWRFTHGYIDKSDPTLHRQVRVGPTSGEVDVAAGVISLDLVGDFQAYPAEPEDRRLQVTEIRSQILIGQPYGDPTGLLPLTGLVYASDRTDNGWLCDVYIFTADEDPADWSWVVFVDGEPTKEE